MKIFPLLLICLFNSSWILAQSEEKQFQNSLKIHQNLFYYEVYEFQPIYRSTSFEYVRYFKNVGVGLGINRIQMKKEGLKPIQPYEEVARRDNLHLYYANVILSYRFVKFCPVKNLGVDIDLAPSFLIAGENYFYGEIDNQTLQHNSFWKNPDRMEYETKFNLMGRLGVNYTFFDRYVVGIETSTYLKYISPTFMSLPIPFSPGKRQLSKSSFWSIAINFNF